MLTVYSGTITINARSHIRALIFLQDGRHLLSGSDDGRVRQWRVNDGVEVGGAMNTGDTSGMAVSRDGNWIVCGGGRVASVWNMKTRQGPVLTISDHSPNVNPVDISPDSSRFATGADDRRVFIWDIVTGKLLVGPLQHDDIVLGLRFSPDGDRIATGDRRSLRIYNAVNGDLLRTFQVPINSWPGNPILWSSAQSIFALSVNAFIHLGADEGRVFSNWTIPGALVHNFANFAMASNGRFIAAYVGNSISLWDPFTSARISSVITNPSEVWSIAISPDNKYLASSIAGGVITIRNLDSIIPAYYLVGQQPPGGGADLQALRDEFQALKSLYGAFFGNWTCVRLTANPNQMCQGAGVPILNPTALKHNLQLLHRAFRMVLTASKAMSAIYTSHAYKTEPARLSCNH